MLGHITYALYVLEWRARILLIIGYIQNAQSIYLTPLLFSTSGIAVHDPNMENSDLSQAVG